MSRKEKKLYKIVYSIGSNNFFEMYVMSDNHEKVRQLVRGRYPAARIWTFHEIDYDVV